MKNQNRSYQFIIIPALIIFGIISCNKKYDGEENSLETIRNANNNSTYSKTKLDSLQATNVITSQKVQDILDLSTLYTSGNKDTEIDSVIYTQMQSHFLSKDSSNLKPLLREMDSLKVRYAKVSNLTTSKAVKKQDTLDFATFDVEYYDNKRTYITTVSRKAQYLLKASPVQFKKEFKFYFVNFYKKDSDTLKK
ncbi:hypothetical protein [Epilithonimonas sp.]|uniref:hypothetical protein n=1 Tax=Epilithonimonas sp. TaxID=2894511 RepID=UPI0028A0C4D2|nr:hypothetical protein [Epilithonimonas sp.]